MLLYYESSDFYGRNDYKHLIFCVNKCYSIVVLIKFVIFKKYKKKGSGLTFCTIIQPDNTVNHQTFVNRVILA